MTSLKLSTKDKGIVSFCVHGLYVLGGILLLVGILMILMGIPPQPGTLLPGLGNIGFGYIIQRWMGDATE